MNRFLVSALLTCLTVSAPAAAEQESDILKVIIDQARVLKIEQQASTVIIGNPAIVDVTVHDSMTLVLTGRSYGITNLVVLDRDGTTIIDEEVTVSSNEAATVRLFRQASRMTYACSPECEPTITIGDDIVGFSNASGQFGTRQSMAASAAK